MYQLSSGWICEETFVNNYISFRKGDERKNPKKNVQKNLSGNLQNIDTTETMILWTTHACNDIYIDIESLRKRKQVE